MMKWRIGVLIPGVLLGALLRAAAVPSNIVLIISDDGGYADWEFMDAYLQS